MIFWLDIRQIQSFEPSDYSYGTCAERDSRTNERVRHTRIACFGWLVGLLASGIVGGSNPLTRRVKKVSLT